MPFIGSTSFNQSIMPKADGSCPNRAAKNALTIKAVRNTTTNQAYWIKASTSANAPVQQVYCLMDSTWAGGGWMIVSNNDAANSLANTAVKPRPTAYPAHVGTTGSNSYSPSGVWNINAYDMTFNDIIFVLYSGGSFTNINAYANANWSSPQTLNASYTNNDGTYLLTPTSSGAVLSGFGNKRLWQSSTLYTIAGCGVMGGNTGVVNSATTGGIYYPSWRWNSTSAQSGGTSFCDATVGAPNSNNGYDDWQDGAGLGDVWGTEGQAQNAYRGSAAYVAIR